jgi:tetratricopeptide (TPR) repeat protein
MNLERYDDSLRMLARVISVDPRNPHAINIVGNVYLAKGDYANALAAFDAALAQDATISAVHHNRAIALQRLGNSEEAARAFRHAAELTPDDPAPRSALGAVLFEFGSFDEAAQAFQTALTRDPFNVQTLRRWFELRKADANDPYLQTLRTLVQRLETLPIDQQIELHFTLGKVEADLGRDSESFDHFVAGNAKKRATLEYDETAELALYADTEVAFSLDLVRENSIRGNPSPAPIFIVGMPRSGTTLIEQILASHPNIAPGGERSEMQSVMYDTMLQLRGSFPQWVPDLPPSAYGELGTRYLERIGPLATANRRFTDKLPGNFVYAGMIHLMFPNAHIIHARRDAVDTCISCFSCLFASGQPHTNDLEELGRFYRAHDRLASHWRRVLPAHAYIEVQYEDVVADVETQARRIFDHLQLDWDPRVLEFYKTARPVRTASAVQVRKPIYASSIGRSRPYGDRIAPLLRALGLSE